MNEAEDNNELRAGSSAVGANPVFEDQTFLNYSGLEAAMDTLVTKILTLRAEVFHLAPETGDEVIDDLMEVAELLSICKVNLLAHLATHIHNLKAGVHDAVSPVQREPDSGEG